MIAMKMRMHISLTTKNLTQTEIRKRSIDFMTIKIRSPTKAITTDINRSERLILVFIYTAVD